MLCFGTRRDETLKTHQWRKTVSKVDMGWKGLQDQNITLPKDFLGAYYQFSLSCNDSKNGSCVNKLEGKQRSSESIYYSTYISLHGDVGFLTFSCFKLGNYNRELLLCVMEIKYKC